MDARRAVLLAVGVGVLLTSGLSVIMLFAALWGDPRMLGLVGVIVLVAIAFGVAVAAMERFRRRRPSATGAAPPPD